MQFCLLPETLLENESSLEPFLFSIQYYVLNLGGF